jgi:hypothetical protein
VSTGINGISGFSNPQTAPKKNPSPAKVLAVGNAKTFAGDLNR